MVLIRKDILLYICSDEVEQKIYFEWQANKDLRSMKRAG